MLVTSHIFLSHNIISLELKMHSRVLKLYLHSQFRIYPTATILISLSRKLCLLIYYGSSSPILIRFQIAMILQNKALSYILSSSLSFFLDKSHHIYFTYLPVLLIINIFPKIKLSFYLHPSRHILYLHQHFCGQDLLPTTSKCTEHIFTLIL